MTERPLRDKLGEAIRRSRIGLSQPLWADLDDGMREDYRRSYDKLVILGKELGFEVREVER